MSQKETMDFNTSLKKYIRLFLEERNNRDELEIVFSRGHSSNLTKFDFNNVIRALKAHNFVCTNDKGDYHLNIMNEIYDERLKKHRMTSLRTVIKHLANIQEYCKTNTFDTENVPHYVSFQDKARKVINMEKLGALTNEEYNFRVNYKIEIDKRPSDRIIRENLLNDWENQKKQFRLIKRFTFTHDVYPFKIDCSVVKSSTSPNSLPMSTIQESGIFDGLEIYEIEIECINAMIYGRYADHIDSLIKSLKYGIKLVLSGLQQTNFPISYNKMNMVYNNYMSTLYGLSDEEYLEQRDLYLKKRKVKVAANITAKERWEARKYLPTHTSNFVGPSMITLEVSNLNKMGVRSSKGDGLNVLPMVKKLNKKYVVTEKTDGVRKLLFIGGEGKLYFITLNMTIEFTGCVIKSPSVFNTIIDGEHLLYDRSHKYINRYLMFDLYYLGGEDKRRYPFLNDPKMKYPEWCDFFRFEGLEKFAQTHLEKIESVVGGKAAPLDIRIKKFYNNMGKRSIFRQCEILLKKIDDGVEFDYETDGLVFTPVDLGVGSERMGEKMFPTKKTWTECFKWKPMSQNTIDFLVVTKKQGSTKKDYIGNLFREGVDMVKNNNIQKFKTLMLHVGFRSDKDGYLNPLNTMLNGGSGDGDDDYTTLADRSSDDYAPRYFFPTNPVPSFPAHICNILLEDESSNNASNVILTEKDSDGTQEIIEDKSIVEFRFDPSQKPGWQWIPIRVRHKKTRDFRKGLKNFGNAYYVANSVWRSIHNPVSREMLTTGKNIPFDDSSSDVYYNSSGKKYTAKMRKFHNFIKENVLTAVSAPGNTLFDTSMGKGGDLWKWKKMKLKFIFGIDLSKDNIENHSDGACARYLNLKKEQGRNVPEAYYSHGNAAKNLRNGDAFFTEKDKNMAMSLLGTGIHDKEILPPLVYQNFGIGSEGFDIVSAQFSLHYFFKGKVELHGFMRNISENCKLNGYFVGTCYDGDKIFDELKHRKKGEVIGKYTKKGEKMWEITKKYDNAVFRGDEEEGLEIEVYQDSIDKVFSEYLVNKKYLIEVMRLYGFELAPAKELKSTVIHQAMGSFESIYNNLKSNASGGLVKNHFLDSILKMDKLQKEISFLNMYFIFKKTRQGIDAEKMEQLKIGSDFALSMRSPEPFLENVNEVVSKSPAQTTGEMTSKATSKETSKETMEKDVKEVSQGKPSSESVEETEQDVEMETLNLPTMDQETHINTKQIIKFNHLKDWAPYNYLSTRQRLKIPLEIDGKKYPTVEHYFWSNYLDKTHEKNKSLEKVFQDKTQNPRTLVSESYIKKKSLKKDKNWNIKTMEKTMYKALKKRWETDPEFKKMILEMDRNKYILYFEKKKSSKIGGFISKKNKLEGLNIVGNILVKLRDGEDE